MLCYRQAVWKSVIKFQVNLNIYLKHNKFFHVVYAQLRSKSRYINVAFVSKHPVFLDSMNCLPTIYSN